MYIPITAISMFTGAAVFLGAWWYIGSRAGETSAANFRPIEMFRQFFLYMAIFLFISSSSHLWLMFDPENFPLAASITFTVGHIFTYLALIALARMTCSLVPRLAARERGIVITLAIAAAIVTVVTAITSIWGVQPVYDYEHHVTINNAARPVGAGIGVLTLVTMLPVLVMFIVFAVRSTGPRRIRSLLLATGMVVLIASGTMHNIARSGDVYILADVLTIVGVFILGTGVLYRLEQSLAPTPVRPVLAPSNTV
jgi:hypothetical protein